MGRTRAKDSQKHQHKAQPDDFSGGKTAKFRLIRGRPYPQTDANQQTERIRVQHKGFRKK